MNITSSNIFITLSLMGLVVFIIRASGYWIAGRFRINKTIEAWLNYLPGCIIISIVAPFVLTANWITGIAALITGVAMWRTHNLLIAMIAGIAFVVLARLLT